MGYTKDAISGFSWQTALKVLQTILTLVKIFILARLLSPTDFGLFSLIAIALGITEALTQTGINLTIIQSQQSVKYFIDTAWVIAIIRGVIIAILMLLLGLVMGKFYAEPQLPLFVAMASLIPVIKGFINPSIISLQKELRFFRDSVYQLALSVCDLVLAITLGLALHSVTALIFAMIGSAIFEVAISFIFFTDRPTFRYLASRAKTIFANAKWLSISSLFSYLNENADDFILGKTVGTYNLGLYHNGYGIGHRGSYDIAKSASHGTLPIYTKIATDKNRLKKAFIKSTLITLAIGTIISIPLFIFPTVVVEIVLGEKWVAVSGFLPLLAFAGLLQALTAKVYALLYATKQYQYVTSHQALTLVVMIPLIYFLSMRIGVTGAAVALVVARLVATPLLWIGAKQAVKI
jgi:lipopolysaccharide exporter